MINIYFSNLQCEEETNGLGSDEPYVLVTSVNLAASRNIAGFTVPFPAFEVFLYDTFDDVDSGESFPGPGISKSFWGINGQPAKLVDPNQTIFVVALMENDDGSPRSLRTIVKGIVGGAVLATLSFPRSLQVSTLLRDIGDACETPTGGPNFDDKIGGPQELIFTTQELIDAELGATISKTLTFEGEGGRYVLTFNAGPLVRINAGLGATVTTLLPFDDHVDVFATASDGAVWSTFFESKRNWQNWFPIRPETKMKPGATVTPIQPFSGHVDLFATTDDGDGAGTVKTIFFENGVWREWQSIGERKMHPGTTVTALMPFAGHVDLFATDPNGVVMSTFFQGNNWLEWFPIRGTTKMHPGATVSALQPFSGHVDLFVTDSEGTVMSIFFEDGDWLPQWFPICPQTKMHPGATVTALMPFEGHVDLFATTSDGTVMSIFFENGNWLDHWFPIGPQTKMSPGATITALMPFEGHVDLFATTGDDRRTAMSIFFENNWLESWFPIHPESQMQTGATITPIMPFEGHVDLFAVNSSGRVVTTFFPDGGGWHDWFAFP